VELRRRQKCNMLASLLLSQGVPMLLAGDELGRTQLGNNNAYCQDNQLTWIDWSRLENDGFTGFVRRLIALRRNHIVFRRHRFFRGESIPGTSTKDIVWLRPDGAEMTDGDWGDPARRSIAYLISGEAGQYHLDLRGEGQTDDSFLVILNAGDEAIEYTLPQRPLLPVRRVVFDTGNPGSEGTADPGDHYRIGGRSVAVLRYCNPAGAQSAPPAQPA
jgi:isoamylase